MESNLYKIEIPSFGADKFGDGGAWISKCWRWWGPAVCSLDQLVTLDVWESYMYGPQCLCFESLVHQNALLPFTNGINGCKSKCVFGWHL